MITSSTTNQRTRKYLGILFVIIIAIGNLSISIRSVSEHQKSNFLAKPDKPISIRSVSEQQKSNFLAKPDKPPPGFPWQRWDRETKPAEPPPGFPWQRWDSEKHKSKFHDILFNAFHKILPNPFLRYIIRNGTLYCPQNDIADVKTANWNFWHGRVYPIERTINEALLLGRSSAMLNDSRLEAAMSILLDDNSKYSSVGVPLLFGIGDPTTCVDRFPVFLFSRIQDRSRCNTSWMFPEYSMINDIESKNKTDEKSWDETFSLWREHYPWNSKIQKAVWRGTDTGFVKHYPIYKNITNWRQLPRAQLSFLSKDRPDIIDAGISHLGVQGGYGVANFTDYGLMKQHMKSEDFMKYRAIIDVDGNSWSSRLSSLLAMNSVVIKVEPIWSQYFFDELQPWVHYVPANFSNLIETVEYVVSDDNMKQMQEIVNNAQSWARSKITRFQVVLDMMWILVAYVETLNASSGESDWRALWAAKSKEKDYSFDLVPVPILHDSYGRGDFYDMLLKQAKEEDAIVAK